MAESEHATSRFKASCRAATDSCDGGIVLSVEDEMLPGDSNISSLPETPRKTRKPRPAQMPNPALPANSISAPVATLDEDMMITTPPQWSPKTRHARKALRTKSPSDSWSSCTTVRLSPRVPFRLREQLRAMVRMRIRTERFAAAKYVAKKTAAKPAATQPSLPKPKPMSARPKQNALSSSLPSISDESGAKLAN